MEIFHRFSHTRALKFQGLEINPDNKFGNDRKMLDVKNVIIQVKKKGRKKGEANKGWSHCVSKWQSGKKKKRKRKNIVLVYDNMGCGLAHESSEKRTRSSLVY